MKQMVMIVLAMIALVFGAASYFGIDWLLTAWCIGIGLFVFGKLILGMNSMQGHGVFKRRGIHGLSIPFLVVIGIETVLLACIATTSFMMPEGGAFFPETISNLKAVSVSLIAGFLASFVFWATYLYRATYYGSEYDARIEFRNSGCSDDEIEEKIDTLTEAGAFGKTEGWWPSFLKSK